MPAFTINRLAILRNHVVLLKDEDSRWLRPSLIGQNAHILFPDDIRFHYYSLVTDISEVDLLTRA